MNGSRKKWVNDGQPVSVSREIFDGFEKVRLSGETNMLDRPRVARLAHEAGDYAAALWATEHPDEYARALFNGFKIEDDPPA